VKIKMAKGARLKAQGKKRGLALRANRGISLV
jgi:hypothetical protein